jgi:Protein of unknown function (DUF4013)
VDIGKSFTFMFEDPNWVAKLAIGGAILLVGTLFFWLILIPLIAASAIVLGYSLAVTRNVAEGSATPLPEWNDFGALLVKGLTGIVGAIIWLIPLIILACCLGLVNAALSGAAAGSSNGSQPAQGFIALFSTCLSCIIAIVGLLESVTLYAPLTRFALNNQLNTFWDFAGNWAFIQANMGNYIIAFLLGPIVASFIAGFGVIACVIGVFFTQFWAYLVSAHLFGQVARGMPAAQTLPPMTPMTPPPMAPTSPA